MLNIKTITIKNFMSIGDHAESINLEDNSLTLILGENLDTTNDTGVGRNGVGKTAIISALSFGLFGQAISNISKDNLVNNINKKGMFVVIEFEKDSHKYTIERGRKPNFLKFTVDDNIVNSEDTNEAQGESKDTQDSIEAVLGFSHNIFKHIVALNTKTLPFLSLNTRHQKDFIEELLGILQLSQKAEVLKERIRESKNEIKQEEFKIQTQKDSNERILKSIKDLERRSVLWVRNHDAKILELENAIIELDSLDVNIEIEQHKKLQEYNEINKNIKSLEAELKRTTKLRDENKRQVDNSQKELEHSLENICPTCEQGIHGDKLEEITNKIQDELERNLEHQIELNTQYTEVYEKHDKLSNQLGEFGTKPETFYNSIDEAYNHKNSVEMLLNELSKEKTEENPYIEQIETLNKTGLQEISFDTINSLSKMRDHEEFLWKLLTSKDSFIRKKILDQNLSYLNSRLTHYLEKLGLPHLVSFLNDMSVEIKYLGESFDFDQLSRGEGTRLILALSWSFRDIFELLNNPLNLLVIDELLDSGLDVQGCESAIQIIRAMARDRNRNVFLISHREELMSKISCILKVIKENGFTSFEYLTDFV